MRSLSKKIRDLRRSLNMQQGEFAKAVGGVTQSTVSRWEKGTQAPATAQVAKLAALAKQTTQEFVGISDDLAGERPRTVTVTGELQAGSWSEALDWPLEDQYEVPAPLPPKWEGYEVYAREVRGTSMNKVYPAGTVVYIVPLSALGRRPVSGERVAVQRVSEDGQYEATLKEYVVDEDGRVWLWPRSTDPKHQEPLPYANKRGGDVVLMGVVIAAFVVERVRPRF